MIISAMGFEGHLRLEDFAPIWRRLGCATTPAARPRPTWRRTAGDVARGPLRQLLPVTRELFVIDIFIAPGIEVGAETIRCRSQDDPTCADY